MARRLDLSRGVGGGGGGGGGGLGGGRLGGGRLERLDLSRGGVLGGGGGPRFANPIPPPAANRWGWLLDRSRPAITALLVGGGRFVEWGGGGGWGWLGDSTSAGMLGGGGGGGGSSSSTSAGVLGGVFVLPTPFRRRRRIDGVGCLIALDLSCIYRKYKYM